MNIGIIGPPLSGKTTTFHLLTATLPDPSAAFKREVQTGVTHVPDARVVKLAEISHSKKIIYTTVEYVDTPGIEAGASKTDWFAAALSGGVKNSDALLLVVRAFGADQLSAGADPERDIRAVQDELILADLVVLDNRLERMRKQRRVKAISPQETAEMELLERGKLCLESGMPLRMMNLLPPESKMLRGFQFLSAKPMLVVVNVGEGEVASAKADDFGLSAESGLPGVVVSAPIELEISRLSADEQKEFLSDLGLAEPSLDRVIRASYGLLGVISFFTVGEDEVRAWTIRRGTVAREAAGAIHSDIERGFIRAEVVRWDDLLRHQTMAHCRDKALLKLEGKEYVVADGDVVHFRFNV
jgi:GTP-binding protein YchF